MSGERDRGRENQDRLSSAALTVFRLNGQVLGVADELARPGGLTAAWWQVLGAVLHEPLPVAGIARAMGITRQSVQRIADLLVARGLAEYAPNPAHRRAKLLRPTREGLAAVGRINPGHAEFAARLAEELGEDGFARTVEALQRLSAALDVVTAAPRTDAPAGPAAAPTDAQAAAAPTDAQAG
ncbi:helix-turn-helix domain-containing protein [Streptomyces sp. BE147]|uniref:MarR family winged helix-turn-helix transcriptional regulator n=1 Tax=Streptomyces sp. BE147 TaxID=3002524 RepID=UPI002E75DB32|nr:helix-turn-helix domain-containing protein [Streptomyces sp. BE147]MEE1737959.1 helix-turn-helix domain-containing protein [Streptomyces sp. BE147]